MKRRRRGQNRHFVYLSDLTVAANSRSSGPESSASEGPRRSSGIFDFSTEKSANEIENRRIRAAGTQIIAPRLVLSLVELRGMHPSMEIYRQQNRVACVDRCYSLPSTTRRCCVTSRDLRGQIISRIVRIFPTVRPASDMHIEYFREFFIRTHFPREARPRVERRSKR